MGKQIENKVKVCFMSLLKEFDNLLKSLKISENHKLYDFFLSHICFRDW